MAPRTTSYGNFLSVKQNLSPAWLLGPLAWEKLITYGNFLRKSIGHGNFANIRQILKSVTSYEPNVRMETNS